ncbi:MAG: helix-turn-helix transcriptional regulator [Lachnospiraceae bacterium]|nr:helix-turn-helix transcriptional regulator [Lachnospiraceae bacterium]
MDKIYMRIKDLREQYGFTQEYVGNKLEISQQAYSNYEMNKRALPARHALELAKLYHVSTDYILGLETEPMETLFPDAEYVRNVTYRKLVNSLMRLNDRERNNVYSYLSFLRHKK